MRTFALSLPLVLAAACATVPMNDAAKKAATPPVFVENDYTAALADARERNVPLFIDAWAPWCHTCQSMNAFVLNDPALGKIADRFVWLKIDTERAENAAFVAKYPMDAWPTLFVVDPADEQVALRWLGSASVEQLERLLQDGERTIAAKQSGDGSGPEALLAKADQRYGEGRAEEAASLYREALAASSSRWDRRGRVVESLLFALSTTDQLEACARTALQEAAALPRSSSYANATATGLFCALEAPAGAAWRFEAIARLEEQVRDIMSGAAIRLASDDASSLYQARAMAREAQGDLTGRNALVEEWLGFLERTSKRARNAKERAVFDSHFVTAALMIGKPERALSVIERSEKDLPDDYNGPARRALLLKAMGRHEEAIAASDLALAKVYGPRKLRVLYDRAEIFLAKGERMKAVEALETATTYAATLADAQRPRRLVTKIEEKLVALKAEPMVPVTAGP